MAHFTTLPAEVLHHIFTWLDPRDLGALPRVCQVLHAHVKGNWKLCQDVYLNHLVSKMPRNKPPNRLLYKELLHVQIY